MTATGIKPSLKKTIVALSILIPLAVALLFKVKLEGLDFSFLPPIYASINALTAICLVFAVYFIKNGNRIWHERLIKTCMTLSALFLLMYVAYHATSESTSFGGQGAIKNIYYFVLITHILLSVVVIPFVLFTYAFAASSIFDRHKKLAKITFPLWLYVAVSGVVVYLMISPYYA